MTTGDDTSPPDKGGADDDVRLRETEVAMSDQRDRARMLVRGARAVQFNRQLQNDAGLRSGVMAISHGDLRDLLMDLVGVPVADQPAFDARLKHTLKQGVVPDDRPAEGGRQRGHRRYVLIDVLQLALVFQLQRALIDPAAAAAFVKDHQSVLAREWANAFATKGQHWLDIEIDAYAVIGGEGKGRPSGRVGALAIVGTRQQRLKEEPAPALRIDLAALANRIGGYMTTLQKAVRLLRDSFADSADAEHRSGPNGNGGK